MKTRIALAVGLMCLVAFGACLVDIPAVIPCDVCGVPAGWSAVLFATSRAAPCPTNMVALDLLADPQTPPSDTCACDCSVTAVPPCLPQVLTYTYSLSGPPCTMPGVPLYADGGCYQLPTPGVVAPWAAIPSVPPVDAGACTGTATSDPSKVITAAARICRDPNCSAVCTPANGFQPCWVAPGDVACPPSAPTRHSVGTALDVSCGACTACSVSLDGGCQGQFAGYTDTLCTIPIGPAVPVDGTCAASDSDATERSYQYTPAAAGVTCTPGTSLSNVALASVETVCCP